MLAMTRVSPAEATRLIPMPTAESQPLPNHQSDNARLSAEGDPEDYLRRPLPNRLPV